MTSVAGGDRRIEFAKLDLFVVDSINAAVLNGNVYVVSVLPREHAPGPALLSCDPL